MNTTQTNAISSWKDGWTVSNDPTICSFKQIQTPYTSRENAVILICGYCKVHYIKQYYNTKNYSFPTNILSLISDFIYNKHKDFKNKYYINDPKKNMIPKFNYKANELSKLPRRIKKEMIKLSQNKIPEISIMAHPENYRYFLCAMEGPSDSPYQGGIFYVEIFLSKQYPMKPPKVRFLTPMFHPNIDRLGRICLDIVKDKWTPALTLSRVMLHLQLLLISPNPHDPLDQSIADLWKMNQKEAHRKAKETTIKYAVVPKDLMY